MLTHAGPKEARYIVRTVLEELRVGVAEGIVRDSIARAFGLEPSAVENAWFLYPNYGEIARIARDRGEAGLKGVTITLGRPIVVSLAEKAPGLKEAMESYGRAVIEFKYDGARMQIHKQGDRIWLFTRRLEDVTRAFPDIAELCRRHIRAESCIIEGEALAIDPESGRPMPFQMLSTRIKRKHSIEKAVKQIPVQVNLFDIILLEGESLSGRPLEERRKALSGAIDQARGRFQLAEQLATKDLGQAEAFYRKALDAGQEGVMVKNLDARYVPSRRVAGGWLKVKPVMETLDLAIMGAVWGTGKRAGWFGSFILGCRDPATGRFLECGMLGTGIKEKKAKPEDVTLDELTGLLKPHVEQEEAGTARIKPRVVIEVAYEEIQVSPTYSSGIALRFPRFIRLRPDKSPDEADTIDRIKSLLRVQKGRGQF
jgi:DNA ligase-1